MLGRRGFLGLLAGAAAMPLIKPKRTLVSFFCPPPVTEVTLQPGETLAQAIARLSPSGGNIILPVGRYVMSEDVELSPNTTIQFSDKSGMIGCAIKSSGPRKTPMIRFNDEGTYIGNSMSGDVEVDGPEGCVIMLARTGLMLGGTPTPEYEATFFKLSMSLDPKA